MQIFITGANGFIGGAVASALIADSHTVRGLVRSKAKADAVAARGIEPVVGSLDDAALLQDEARAADAVVNAASSDHRGAVEALIAGLSGSGKPLIHSSSSSIVADLAMGEPSDRIFHEAPPIEPHADKAARVAIDRLVLAASGIRSAVLCNAMIYGNAMGAPAQSVQIPALVRQAKASGGRAVHRTRTEPLVECAYRRCRGALYVGHREGTRRHVHVRRERRGGVGRNLEGHRGPTWSRRSTILVRRAGDRRLGSEHGSVLARLKQPCARQSRDRSRLVSDPAVSHDVDCQRTHLGPGSRRENEVA